MAYVHPLCRRLSHQCYRTLAAVAGKASAAQVRVGVDAHSERTTMISFLRASNERRGATPGLTRTKPRLPRRYISDASTTTGLGCAG